MNKTYAEGGMKQGIGGKGTTPTIKAGGVVKASSVSMPMKPGPFPGVSGKTQPSRTAGVTQTGPLGPFYVKKVGL